MAHSSDGSSSNTITVQAKTAAVAGGRKAVLGSKDAPRDAHLFCERVCASGCRRLLQPRVCVGSRLSLGSLRTVACSQDTSLFVASSGGSRLARDVVVRQEQSRWDASAGAAGRRRSLVGSFDSFPASRDDGD